MGIERMLREGEKGLMPFHNLIGIGVIVMLIIFSGVFWFTYTKEKEIAKTCGFENEKIHCVCTGQAWKAYSDLISQDNDLPGAYNITTASQKIVGSYDRCQS